MPMQHIRGGVGVWEQQAQLLEKSHPEGKLGTSPSSILGWVQWSTWQTAPTQAGWTHSGCSRDLRGMLVVQGVLGTHGWPAVAHTGGWYSPALAMGCASGYTEDRKDGKSEQPSPPPGWLSSFEKKWALSISCVFLEDPGTAFPCFNSPFQFPVN